MASECPGIRTSSLDYNREHCPCCHPEAHATLEAVRPYIQHHKGCEALDGPDTFRFSYEEVGGDVLVQSRRSSRACACGLDALAASPRGDVLTEEERAMIESFRRYVTGRGKAKSVLVFDGDLLALIDRLAPAPTR